MTDPDASNVVPPLAISPFCRRLHSKKLAFRASPPQTEEDVLDASRHCWCRLTQTVIGPDGEFVGTNDCRRGRSCFEGFE